MEGYITGGKGVGTCRFSKHLISLRDHTLGRKFQGLTQELIKALITDVIGMIVMYCIQSCKPFYNAKNHPLLHLIKPFLVILSTVWLLVSLIYDASNSQTCFSTSSCTILCYKKPKYFCVMKSTYALARWLNFHLLRFQCAGYPAQPNCHWCFPNVDIAWTCLFPKPAEDTVRDHLSRGGSVPGREELSSSRVLVLNQVQWFILVTFKFDVPNAEVHELWDSRLTLSVYCGRYISIMSEEVHVFFK